MLQKSPWWSFVLAFALMIAGIQSLRWWIGPAPVQAQSAASKQDAFTTSAAMRHLHCQPRHWRKLVMQQ